MVRSKRILAVPVLISLTAAFLFIGQQIYEIVFDTAIDAEFCASPLKTDGMFLPIPWGAFDTCNLDLPIVGLWFGMAFVVSLLTVVPVWLITLWLWKFRLQ
jgi:hypothetical protein